MLRTQGGMVEVGGSVAGLLVATVVAAAGMLVVVAMGAQ